MDSLNNIKLPQNVQDEEYRKLALDFSKVDISSMVWTGAMMLIEVDSSLLFIKRSESMPSHKGQVAFVGGYRKQGEQTPFETLEREFKEEMGIGFEGEWLGLLPPVFTSGGNLTIPVWCRWKEDESSLFQQIQSNGEWVDAFTVSLVKLSEPSHWSFGMYSGQRNRRLFFRSLMGEEYTSLNKKNERAHLLWGATGRVVYDFFKILNQIKEN